MKHIAQIELVGGPLNGIVHEVSILQIGTRTLLPARIGLIEGNFRHWYDLEGNVGKFVDSERLPEGGAS